MKNYRSAFAVTLTLNVLLGAGLAFLWRGSNPEKTQGKSAPQETASTPSPESSTSGMATAAPASTETPLVPVQLTPQRMQSIGVKTGVVEGKSVEDEIRTVGNVEVEPLGVGFNASDLGAEIGEVSRPERGGAFKHNGS